MPRVARGNSVWTETWKNGVVRFIDYEAEDVYCFFYNSKTIEAVDLHCFGSENFYEPLNQWILTEV